MLYAPQCVLAAHRTGVWCQRPLLLSSWPSPTKVSRSMMDMLGWMKDKLDPVNRLELSTLATFYPPQSNLPPYPSRHILCVFIRQVLF